MAGGNLVGKGSNIITNFASGFFGSNSLWIGVCKLSSDSSTNLIVPAGLTLGGSNITSWTQVSGGGTGNASTNSVSQHWLATGTNYFGYISLNGVAMNAWPSGSGIPDPAGLSSNNVFTGSNYLTNQVTSIKEITNCVAITLGGVRQTSWPTGALTRRPRIGRVSE